MQDPVTVCLEQMLTEKAVGSLGEASGDSLGSPEAPYKLISPRKTSYKLFNYPKTPFFKPL